MTEKSLETGDFFDPRQYGQGAEQNESSRYPSAVLNDLLKELDRECNECPPSLESTAKFEDQLAEQTRKVLEHEPKKSAAWRKTLQAASSMLLLFELTTGMASIALAREWPAAVKPSRPTPEKSDQTRAQSPEKQDSATPLSPETRAALKEISKNGPQTSPVLETMMIPFGADYYDDSNRQETSYKTGEVPNLTTASRFDDTQLESVRFFQARPDNAVDVTKLKLGSSGKTARGFNYAVYRTKDSHGNAIRYARHQSETDKANGRVKELIEVFLPFPGAKPGSKKIETRNIDLRQLGLPEVDGLIEVQPLPKNPEVDMQSYDFYTQEPSRKLSAREKKSLAALGQGQTAAEKFCGANPGEHIKNVFLVHSNKPQGEAQGFLFDDTTVYTDALLNHDKLDGQTVGAHEGFHVIAENLDLVGTEITNIYGDTIKKHPEYLSLISEENFENRPGSGGHAEDDEKEFFVSLMNTLRSPSWEASVERMNSDERRWYEMSLQALQTDLKRQQPVLLGTDKAPTPLAESLKDKLNQLARQNKPRTEPTH